ncbi:MAG TPA: exlusion protein FxsA [Methylophilaceae bacterium]|nr:exlusion protein FxsA [Methylophilaceae bacterium]HAJ72864.1 exlusion protein FxsA [Methylophilaceae bacterium]
MRSLIPLILLAFPFAEIFLLVKLAYLYGWWLFFYLVVVGYLGLQLVKGEKLLMSAKVMQSLGAGGNPIKTIMGSARNMVAGVLLIIPGVLSDVIAVVLLLIPIQQEHMASSDTQYEPPKRQTPPNQGGYRQASNDDVIEGEYTHIKEEQDTK